MTDILEALKGAPADDMIRLVALGLPIFVVLLLIVLLVRLRARRKAARQTGEMLRATGAISSDAGVTGVRPRPFRGHDLADRTTPDEADGSTSLAAEEDLEGAIASLEAKLKDAMNTQENTSLAPIYLDLARKYFAAGEEGHYLEALYAAARIAAQHGPIVVHAEIRLELAEAALRSGDTTGACEQWQMARTAFEVAGQTLAQDRVDELMRKSGCPTDWVLTDF